MVAAFHVLSIQFVRRTFYSDFDLCYLGVIKFLSISFKFSGKFQKTLQYARSKVDYAIAEFIYMLPSDMNLRTGKIKDYNNKRLASSSSFNIGINLKINLDDDKHIEKDKPDIKSKEEDKRDIKIMKTKPDMNKITYEEEKAALILEMHDHYFYSIVSIKIIYFLLVFVIKYVQVKTPAPVISAHKF